jgi:hypothetical protein
MTFAMRGAQQSLRTEREDGYLDAVVGVTAIAAGETVAALLGRPAAKLPEKVTSWVAINLSPDARRLAPLAIAAIDDVLGDDSELRELWEENEDESPAWIQAVTELRNRVSSGSSA